MKGPLGQRDAGIASWFDTAAHRATAGLARHTSRRGFLGRLGALMAGAAAVPLLPVARAFGAEDAGDAEETTTPAPAADGIVEYGDPRSCEYWRYCALGGSLCSCCGGTMNSCPPGAEPSPITWVGTCRNPVDDTEYLISYNDCCGKAYCPRCSCHRTEGAKPSYFPSKSSNVLWCFGTESNAYHCTMAAVIGAAPEDAEAETAAAVEESSG